MMGPLGLAYTEVAAYARDHWLEVDETVYLLGMMDSIFLEHAAAKAKA